MRDDTTLSGILLVDKSPGPTSHDVVLRVRRVLRTRRVGHTGTLDPFASGLLVLCVGRATRLSEYMHIPAKRYEAELRLGVETESHDREGAVVSVSDAWKGLTLDRVGEVLRSLEGTGVQQPPAYSAKRLGGQRAHSLARAGVRVDLAPARITIHSLIVLQFEPPMLRLEARVSTGTYVRALARDLGRQLGCGAHLTALRRTSIGDIDVREGLPDQLLAESTDRERILSSPAWREPGDVLSWLPSRRLKADELALVETGRPVDGGGVVSPGPPANSSGWADDERPVRLMYGDRLVGIAQRKDDRLQPRKVLLD